MLVVDEKSWTFSGEEYKQVLAVKNAFEVEDGMVMRSAISDDHANVFLSFSYKTVVCKAFEDLKNSFE